VKNSNYFVRVVRLIPFLLILTSAAYAQTWSAFGTGTNGVIYAETVYNNQLVVAGNFTTAGGSTATRIAVWNGSSWSTLGTGFNARVNALTVYNGNLIAAGNFTTAGGVTANKIAMWNGTAWSQVGSGIDNGQVYALAVYSGNLIAGGTFTTIGGVTMNRIARWNGSNWSILTNGVNNEVDALCLFNGNLIVGGRFTTTGVANTNRIASWNGTAWSALNLGIDNGYVYALEVYNSTLVAGGSFTTIGGVSYNYVAKWSGTAWSGLSSGVNNTVQALRLYLGNLYAGGSFTTAGGNSASLIASWNGTTWSALGTGISGTGQAQVNSLLVWNGFLTAGGLFNTAGGLTANNIAAWGVLLSGPTLLAPANNSIGQSLTPLLDWSDITGALTYEVQVSTDSLFGTTVVNQTGLAASQYSVPASILSNYTVYYWRARGNSGVQGNWSTVWHFRTILAVPTLLTPANAATGVSKTPLLDWSNVTGAADYRVQVSTNSSFTTTVIDQSALTVSQYQVLAGALLQNTMYYWRAKAYTGTDSGAWSGSFYFTTAPLAAPTLLTPSNGAVNQSLTPLLDWNDVTGALTYDLQVSADSLFGTTLVNQTGLATSQYTIPSSILSSYTTYYWRARGNDGLAGTWSAVWHFKTMLIPPTLLSPANNTTGVSLTPLLDWSDVTGAANYRVQVSTSASFTTTAVDQSSLSASQYQVLSNALSQNTTYYWRVRAYTGTDSSTWTGNFTFTTAALNVPALISPVNDATGQSLTPLLDWSDVGGASTYEVQVSTDSLFGTTTIDQNGLTQSQYTVTSGHLSNYILYYWRARAISGTPGSWSSVWHFRTILSVPALLLPANNATGVSLTPLFDWSDVTGAANYRLQLSTSSGFGTTAIDQAGLTVSQYQALAGSLAQNTLYYWRVKAYTGTDSGAWTGNFTFTTSALGVPSLLSPANGATNQSLTLLLDWSDVISATGYRIQIALDSSFNSIAFDTTGVGVSQANVPSGKLSSSTLYYWRVNASNGFGSGGWSAVWHFTTLNLAPPVPILVSPANNATGQNLSLTLVWNRSAGALSYRVQLALDSMFTNLILNDSTVTDSTRTVSGLNPLTYYWWRVNAKGSGMGVSAFSSAYDFKTIGTPFPVTLLYPPNNSTNQPVSLTFQWNSATEQMAPNGIGGGKYKKFGVVSISNYWFELVSDTVSFANMVRDTTLTDTLKTMNGLNYLTRYYWRVKAKNQTGWGSFSPWFNMTTQVLPPAFVNITVIPGGYYDPYSGQLNMSDTVLVVLVDSATCTPRDSSRVIIDSISYSANLSFAQAPTGNYYIYVFQRNHLAISSAYTMGVTRGSLVSYDFTTDSSKTYGNNVIKVSNSPVRWGMIPGDANQDGYVDGLDQTLWLAQNGQNGYFSADFNGDTYVDGLDQTIWMVYNGNSSSLPCYFSHILRPVHVILKKGVIINSLNKVAPNVKTTLKNN
jgi:hypothetical protein